ncbi:hypothetical protein OKA05_13645 [Luteolibacter arcticus]|uniref:ABC transporter permease n=1 Tax=Luteolibacter arcticus TaxID=1581411 RepID=A0ABT3GJA3_9BACT|nr:hypothetical protein [Luteolibacter arcticus]MCW1923603.1 hypothetical protein [Luteolibacter arcticus]
MTAAIFRAEFLRALPVWPWLLASHALAVISGIVPSGQAGVRTELLGSIASWGVGSLSLFLVVRSLWEENPNRSEHFLATRPMRLAGLLKGKAAGMLILIVVPFVLAEAAVLLGRGQSAHVIGIGTLQAVVVLLVLLGVAFPAVWGWSKRSQAFVALPAAFATGIASAALLDRAPSLRISGSPYLQAKLVSMPVMLCGLLALGMVAACCALIFGRGRSFRRVPAFVALSCVIPAAMMALAGIEPGSGEKRVAPSLVHLTLSNREMGDRLANWLEIDPPPLETQAEGDVVWSVASLRVNGRRAEPWPKQGIGDRLRASRPEMAWNRPIQQALRERYGDQLKLPEVLGKTVALPAATALPGEHDPARMLDLEVGLLGALIDWQVVAEVPVRNQAETRWENTRWAIRGLNQADGGINIQFIETTPYLWLTDPANGHLPDRGCDRYFLVRESDGKITPLSDMGLALAPGWRRVSLGLRERMVMLRDNFSRFDRDMEDPFVVPAANYRLVIVRGIPSGRVSVDWITSSPISCAGLWTPTTGVHSPPPPDPRAGTALEWLQQNPPPASGASEEAVQAWLDQFAPRISNHESNETNHQLKAAVGSLFAEHPALVIRTIRALSPFARGAGGVFGWAMMDHLPRDYARKMTARDFDEGIYRNAVRRGWQGDLIGMAAERARMGFGWQVEEVLISSPKEVGFSEAEWRDFYRLYPTADAFRALAGVVLPREYLEKETDRRLEDYEPPLPNPNIDPLLDLALARGRSEAPRWLRDAIRRKQATETTFASVWVKDPVRKWFEFPSHLKTDDEVVGWFLGQEPVHFVFDPASEKFHLR